MRSSFALSKRLEWRHGSRSAQLDGHERDECRLPQAAAVRPGNVRLWQRGGAAGCGRRVRAKCAGRTGKTELHLAVMGGGERMVKLLLRSDPWLGARNEQSVSTGDLTADLAIVHILGMLRLAQEAQVCELMLYSNSVIFSYLCITFC